MGIMSNITFLILFLFLPFMFGFSYDTDYIGATVRSDNCGSPIYLAKCNKKCSGTALCYHGICVCPKQKEYGDILEAQLIAPMLRHHIAHFCPNLDVARACIRKCMKVAKPAFCGKDHVCYCGHKYSSNDRDPEIDPQVIHNQFKDLYEKYFGTEMNPIDSKEEWILEDSPKKLIGK